MSQLTTEVKQLIEKHVEEISKKNQEILRELNIYRWGLRTFFVLLFGGSILGFLKLQDYLDDRIQRRSEELSGIIYGSAAQSAGDPTAAIEQYVPFLENLENPVFRPSESIRSIYYSRFLQALADDLQINASGDFLVSPAYAALLESKTYKRDLIANLRKWNQDSFMLNTWGRCLIKFEKSPEKINEAFDMFRRANALAEKPNEKAANYFALALLATASGNIIYAHQNLILANETSPVTHSAKNLTGSYKDDLGGEYQLWDRASRIYGKPDFAGRYEALVKNVISELSSKKETISQSSN
jgi:hypothetical protein